MTCAVAVAVAIAIPALQQANTWQRITCMAFAVAVAVAVAIAIPVLQQAGVTTGRPRSEICIN